MAAAARVQAWRAAVASLRTPPSSAPPPSPSAAGVCAVLSAAVSQLSANVTAVVELPPHEVAGDIVLLIQFVPANSLVADTVESSKLEFGICRLISDISSRVQLEYRTDALLCLVRFLRRILEGYKGNTRVGEEKFGKGSVQQGAKADGEALKLLVQVIHDHGGQISAEEVDFLLCVLVKVANQINFVAPCNFHKKRGSWHGRSDYVGDAYKPGQEEKEYQKLVFAAIGNLFFRTGTFISKETSSIVIKALRNILEMVSSTTLVEDAVASRYYAAVLRCVHLVLSEFKGSIEDHLVSLVGALRAFFLYGLHSPGTSFMSSKSGPPHGAPIRSGPWQDTISQSQGNCAYRPPHMRGKLAPSRKSGSSDAGSDVEEREGWGCASSDSEQSDGDGQYEEGDRYKSSKVRTSAVLSIQALARADPRALHARWLDLLPTHDALHPRPFQATLFTVLIFDPISKVRMAAASTVASMLEGPARAYLQVAEHKEISRSKSFTTLSSSLGQLVVQFLKGLVHVITNEGHSNILVLSFKALSLLVSASPFSRLPEELLPLVISSVHLKTRDLILLSADQCNIMCAALNCIGVALSCTPPSASVAEALAMGAAPSGSFKWTPVGNGSLSSHFLFPDLISYSLPSSPAAVRAEAFQALKAAVHTYPLSLSKHWDLLSHSILKAAEVGKQRNGLEDSFYSSFERSDGAQVASSMSTGNTYPSRVVEDKVLTSAIKLLDEFLRASCGHQGINEHTDDGFSQPSAFISVSDPIPLLSGAESTFEKPTNGALFFERVDAKTVLIFWMEALRRHLPPALTHPAPTVRSAALTCFAGLTSGMFDIFSLENQGRILSISIHAARNDDTPSVRSAACRAIGVVAGFPQVARSKENLDAAADVITWATTDTFVAVRITASWALANICDALRIIAETSSGTDSGAHAATLSLAPLSECALKAAKDCDKVRANAVRALGNLARFANFGGHSDSPEGTPPMDLTVWKHSSVHGESSEQGTTEANEWLEVLVQTLVSCVTTGNVKVQWNVCHALGNLFVNKTIRLSAVTWVSSVYSTLLLLLRDSTNYKIRIHSAAALAVPVSREDYGDSYDDVLMALVYALEGISLEKQPAPTSFRYNQALFGQLSTTILHVVSLATPRDFLDLKEFLLQKAGFMVEFLSCSCASEEAFCRNALTDKEEAVEAALALKDKPNVGGKPYDERPLPLPKEHHRRYGLQINDSLLNANGRRFQGLKDSKKAARALAEMYRYGHATEALQKLDFLIDKPWH